MFGICWRSSWLREVIRSSGKVNRFGMETGGLLFQLLVTVVAVFVCFMYNGSRRSGHEMKRPRWLWGRWPKFSGNRETFRPEQDDRVYFVLLAFVGAALLLVIFVGAD